MSNLPVVTIQCDWNDVIKLPKCEAWISSKKLNEPSEHDKLITSLNKTDNKIKLSFSSEKYQYVSHSVLSLVVKHQSGLKAVFVAPNKIHKVHKKAILSVSASENAMVVSTCEGDKVLVWDSRTGETLLDLKGHGGPVYKCRFFPSGIVVITAGADGSGKIWSAESGINPVTLIGHTLPMMDISIIEKGRNVVSVSKDGTAKLWDVGESKVLDNVVVGHGTINCCFVAKASEEVEVTNKREVGTGDKVLVIGCEDGSVICTHIGKREELYCKQLSSACNACLVVNDNIIAGCHDGKIIQLSIKDGSEIGEWHESASPVISMAALPNQLFAVGRQDGTCTVISIRDSYRTTRVQLTGSDCDGIRDISFNGKWIFTGSRDSNVRQYDFNQVIVHFK